ncbi:hypothetical protein SKAU_G00048980 [Synaphobranchus kaupii]|uniref:Uncharacterized protein n=1 Tax=Synaphobranchus kaupii TaxID=118154 RepID=A0A9Q1G2L2_SYNKA|nr:hypothetical protein SKAU_G00048980 [Synaphobranchus kaupii]
MTKKGENNKASFQAADWVCFDAPPTSADAHVTSRNPAPLRLRRTTVTDATALIRYAVWKAVFQNVRIWHRKASWCAGRSLQVRAGTLRSGIFTREKSLSSAIAPGGQTNKSDSFSGKAGHVSGSQAGVPVCAPNAFP